IWFKILPRIDLTATCLVTPGTAAAHIPRSSTGGKEKTVAYYPCQWSLLQRDRLISGMNCYYMSKGLENID
uniref:NADH dehydrogenase [ubiquinone] 1 alpha subcomplex subunit 1 n=1 Tax=Neovison vison TaxID=452646 RepID=A0A8C7AMG3_NEOVI